MAWIVYKHTSPSNKVYIGITSKEPIRRFGCKGQRYKNNAHFWSAIQKYGWDAFNHEILNDNLTFEQACQIEKDLIAKYKSYDPKFGYNIALGGQGFIMTDEQRIKLSERAKLIYSTPEKKKELSERSKAMWANEEFHKNHIGEKHPMYGKRHSKESREKIGLTRKERGIKPHNTGKHWSEEVRAKISRSNMGNHCHTVWTEEQKERVRQSKLGSKNPNYGKRPSQKAIDESRKVTAIAVVQIDGDKRTYYESAAEAGRVTGICASNINRACRKERLRAGGYVWEYANKS